mmetsp:Transcript_20633/g.44816  ORF Transcript_20633/g.44816 Transcript_20633/m.44816 type:complete len:99 (+) Transcript_20633:957-1253(+)
MITSLFLSSSCRCLCAVDEAVDAIVVVVPDEAADNIPVVVRRVRERILGDGENERAPSIITRVKITGLSNGEKQILGLGREQRISSSISSKINMKCKM